jgi:hypothetical protein
MQGLREGVLLTGFWDDREPQSLPAVSLPRIADCHPMDTVMSAPARGSTGKLNRKRSPEESTSNSSRPPVGAWKSGVGFPVDSGLPAVTPAAVTRPSLARK